MTTVYPSNDGCFQQDVTKQRYSQSKFVVLNEVSDLNPAERLWDVVELCLTDVQPTNRQQPRDAVMSIWTEISEEYFRRVCHKEPRWFSYRCACTWSSGWWCVCHLGHGWKFRNLPQPTVLDEYWNNENDGCFVTGFFLIIFVQVAPWSGKIFIGPSYIKLFFPLTVFTMCCWSDGIMVHFLQPTWHLSYIQMMSRNL